MMNIDELCFRLGFIEKDLGILSRGSPQVLLRDVKMHTVQYPDGDPGWVASLYLLVYNRGPLHWSSTKDAQSSKLLQWPQDSNV